MSDWNFLNSHRIRTGAYASDDSFGFCGAFNFALEGEARRILCIASDGMGWQHVSVSFGASNRKCPSWEIMCRVKDLFWEPTDWVCQFHPAASEYRNLHEGCLHLWRPTSEKLPTPLAIMVAPPPKQELDYAR